MKERVFPLKLSLVLERSSPLCAMPAHKQVSIQPAGANKPRWCLKPGGVSKKPAAADGRYRPSFKAGDIAMKAAFDHGVPFANGVYTAVVTRNTKVAHDVQFVRQLAVEDPEKKDKV